MLPLASEPLTFCTRCGSHAAPPLGPSFVYGVGAVGFQHCPECGDRWRCLWPQQRRRRRISLRTVAVTAAILIVVGAGVAAYATARSSKPPPELAAATRGAGANGPRGPLPSPAGVRYLVIVAPSNAARTDLMGFLALAPPVTPQSEIDRRVAAFRAIALKADAALGRAVWPVTLAPGVAQLIAADQKLTTDLARGDNLLNRSSFGQQLEAEAQNLRTVVDQVRAGLGLAAVGPLDDSRFALL